MSASKNPDFWRSQGGAGEPSSRGSGGASASGKADDGGGPGLGGGSRPTRKAPPPSSSESSDSRPSESSSARTQGSKGERTGRPDAGAGGKRPSQQGGPSGQSAAAGAMGRIKDAVGSDAGQKALKYGGAVASKYAENKLGGAKPKHADAEVLSKDTGKDMIKRGIGKGLIGAGTGALQGGGHGAAIGGIKGAAVGMAEAINAAADAKKAQRSAQTTHSDAATAPAGTVKGQSNAGGLLSTVGDAALNKGHAQLVSSLSQKAGTVGSAAKGGAIPTPQELKTVAKAGKTFAVEVTKKSAKEVMIGSVVAFGLVFAAVTSITGGSAAAIGGVLTAKSQVADASCTAPTGAGASTASPGAPGTVGTNSLTPDQTNNAKTIIGVAKTISFDKEGAVIGIMTALDESRLNNLDYGDRDSLGLFQQRPSTGWGTKEQILNPVYAAQAFFLGVGGNANPGLSSIPGWRTLDPWVAAQSVQRSGTPDGSNYHKDYDEAQSIVDSLWEASAAVTLVNGANTPSSGSPEPGVNGADGSLNTKVATSGCTTSVDAAAAIKSGDDYPARNESYGRSSFDYAVQCADSVAGGCRGECVDWASWTLLRNTGSYGSFMVGPLGDAMSWGAAAQAHGIKVDMNPAPGDVIYFLPGVGGAGGVGHVSTVKKVNGNGTVDIEEYNFGGDTPATGGGRYHARTISIGEASGYIHFLDPGKSAAENKANLIAKGILVAGHSKWPRPTAA